MFLIFWNKEKGLVLRKFWAYSYNMVIFDTGFSAYYFRTNSFWHTDLQTHVLFFNNVLLAKIVQILVLTFFFNFAITFDSGTLKKPIVPHLKDFFSINKFVFKEFQFLHYFNPKKWKIWRITKLCKWLFMHFR